MSTKLSYDFTMQINGSKRNCRFEQDSFGSNAHTSITVDDWELEDSTGGTDCWLFLDEKSDEEREKFMVDYITHAMMTQWLDFKEEQEND